MTFDRWGNRYVCSNSDHCQQIVIEDRYLARNRLLKMGSPRVSIAADGPAAEVFRKSSVEPWRLVRTRLRVQGLVPGPVEGGGRAAGYFTSATGITCYGGDALPVEFQDDFFVGDVGSNLVHRKRLDDVGIQKSAVRTESRTEFLRTDDNWFRPVQFAVAPDGSLIVLDMYRETVEHPESLPPLIKKHLDLSSGNDRGRIYRIVPKEYRTPHRLLPGQATPQQLVAMLGHSNSWHRMTAARLLFEQPTPEAVTALRHEGLSASSAEARIRAMYLLADMNELEVEPLLRMLDDSDPHVRLHAVRLAERQSSNSEIALRIFRLAADPDVRVRFQVALSLGEFSGSDQAPRIASAIAALANSDGGSEWTRAALASSCDKVRSEVIQRLLTPNNDAAGAGGGQALLEELVREAARAGDEAELREIARGLRNLADRDLDRCGALLTQWIQGSPRQSDSVRRAFGDGAEFDECVKRVVARAESVSVDEQRPLDQRLAAIEVLQLSDAVSFRDRLNVLIDVRQPPEVRAAGLATAELFPADEIADLILKHVASMSPQLRDQAWRVLLARESSTRQLLDRLESGAIPLPMLGLAARQQLTTNPNTELAKRARAVLGAGEHSDRAAIVDQYASKLETLSGDAVRGQLIFRKSCVACHRLEQQGNEIGPNLAAFANRGAAAILQNVLDPNREVDSRFLAYQVLLEDGRTVLGIIASESSTSLTLQTNDGKSIIIARDEIATMRCTTLSLMPENIENELNAQDMADLIAYILSQRG